MPDYQIGVFAITNKAKRKIALVTSKTGQRWIFPKGHPEKGRSDEKIALEEAYEEAGLEGILKSNPKDFEVSHGETKSLKLFCMKVEKELKNWPEKEDRKRAIVTIEEAEQLLDKDLRACLKSMARKYL
ncbi:NUDIX hydrolase [Pelagicoccus mobilis]|uniref:NUDIX domain-containing protein n=1 Tax=Pelagicoccus mobilis TaxID=415221 RepID=A0A934RV08_9BACT|nr:NUDIX domain-containing protein [Pelagicoccus mobilis]MBK1877337.1 NUDIX domain-containing protein [Pelagicoccus mobilis]